MPASTGFTGQGTILQVRNSASPPVYVPVAQLRTIQRSGPKTGTVKITNFDSPNAYEEIRPAIISPGDISASGVLPQGVDIGGTAAGLQALQDARTLATWQIIEPPTSLLAGQTTPGTWTFTAYCSELAFDIAYEKESSFSLKLSVSGAYSFTPAS